MQLYPGGIFLYLLQSFSIIVAAAKGKPTAWFYYTNTLQVKQEITLQIDTSTKKNMNSAWKKSSPASDTQYLAWACFFQMV